MKKKDAQTNAAQASYGTYSNVWFIVGPILGTIVLVGLMLLSLPLWLKITLGLLTVLLVLGGAYLIYMTHALADDDLKKTIRDVVLAKLPWDGQGRVLDIGTGSGLMAIGLALKFPNAQVVGCDTWAAGFMGLSLSRCQDNAVAAGVADRVHFEEGGAQRLPYADGEFDAVVSNYVFHEVREEKDKRRLLREALRVLRPSGAFAFQDLFGMKTIYGDLDALMASLRADGLASLEFARLGDTVDIPLLLRPISGSSGVFYGIK